MNFKAISWHTTNLYIVFVSIENCPFGQRHYIWGLLKFFHHSPQIPSQTAKVKYHFNFAHFFLFGFSQFFAVYVSLPTEYLFILCFCHSVSVFVFSLSLSLFLSASVCRCWTFIRFSSWKQIKHKWNKYQHIKKILANTTHQNRIYRKKKYQRKTKTLLKNCPSTELNMQKNKHSNIIFHTQKKKIII